MARTSAPIGNAIIGQSGGPTSVINESLVGAVLEARRHKSNILKFYGACHGVAGIFNREFIDLSAETVANLENVAATPSAALGSVRMKPDEAQCGEIFKILQSMDVRYFFYIGGNDTAETVDLLQRTAKKADYRMSVFHIPKTIDNDLRVTDHCPGYGSAARFVALAFMGDDLDNRSIPGVKINVVMGRHAGWLTAAAALGRTRPDGAPHLIYVPERPFDATQFAGDVKTQFNKYGRCVIAVSEGLQDSSGRVLAETLLEGQSDAFGNIQLSGTGVLADYLASIVRQALGSDIRVRADTYGYMQRSFAGVRSEVDAIEARQVGRVAVRMAAQGVPDGSIAIQRAPGPRYKVRYVRTDVRKVARVTKEMPLGFINRAGNGITGKFIDYAQPLIGKLPKVSFLKGKPIKLG